MTKQWTLDKGWTDIKDTKEKVDVLENNKEKLRVDFDVYKSKSYDYGYVEKFLSYKGEKTPHKAIIKNGEYIGIVGRCYSLIQNELVLSKVESIAKERNLQLNTMYYGWRMYCILTDVNNEVGVVVSNSVDGTVALRCDALVISDTYNSLIVGSKIRNIYRRHSANLTVNNLHKEIEEIHNSAIKYKSILEKLSNFDIDNYSDTLKDLFKNSNIPEVYSRGLLGYYYIGNKPTVKEVYENICNRIWSKDNDFRTKISLYRKVNDCFFTLGIIDTI